MACAFQVVESENILQFLVSVYNRAASVIFSVFDLLNQKGFYVLWLLVSEQSRKVLITDLFSIASLPRTVQEFCAFLGTRLRREASRYQRLEVQADSFTLN